MIWEVSWLDNRLEMCPNHWDDNFRIYYLSEKMRSQDSEFSENCDLVRKGIFDEKVTKYMEEHVRNCQNEDDNDMYAKVELLMIVTTNLARDTIYRDFLINCHLL